MWYLVTVRETTEGNTLVIEGVMVPEKKEHLYLEAKNGACPICSAGLDVKHTVRFVCF